MNDLVRIDDLMHELRQSGSRVEYGEQGVKITSSEYLSQSLEESISSYSDQSLKDWLDSDPDYFNKVPLDKNQTAILIQHQLFPGCIVHNLVHAVQLLDGININQLIHAFNYVVDKYECLHSSYTIIDGVGYMQQGTKADADYKRIEVTDWSPQDIESWLSEQTDAAYDPEAGNVCRLRVIVNRSGDQCDRYALFGFHHVAGDYHSVEMMIRKTLRVYLQLEAGEQPDLPEPALAYPLWLAEQRARQASRGGQKSADYWQQQMVQPFERAHLNRSNGQVRQASMAGTQSDSHIDGALAEQIHSYCEQHKVSLFVLFLAAYQHLIYRFSGCSDFMVATPTTGRHPRKHADMLGYTINPVLIPSRAPSHASLDELVEHTGQAFRQGLRHRSCPLPDVLAAAKQPADDVFGHMFTLVDKGEPVHGFGPVILTGERGSAYDLNLTVEMDAGGFHLFWRYKSDLYTPQQIEVYQQVLVRILELGIADPQASLMQQNLCFESDDILRGQLKRSLDGVDLATDAVTLFERQASTTPAATAVRCGEQQLRYQQLNQRANQLAHWLQQQGVAAEQQVAICAERGLWMLIGLLAIQKAGAAYVPLDPQHPAERISSVLEMAQPALLLSTDAAADALPANAGVVMLESLAAVLDGLPDTSPQRTTVPQQLAYTLFTSGSTGKPKGVQISRGAFVNHLHAMQRELTMCAADRWLAVTTVTFDIAGLELFLPLTLGAELVIAEQHQVADAAALAALLRQHRITFMQATPASWQMLVEQPVEDWSSLTVLCGGEALPLKLAQQIRARGARLFNVYGPTETTVWSTLQSVTEDRITLGRALLNNQLLVLDDYLNPVPPGMAGELYIGGEGLSRGYIHRADLTADRFIPNPFCDGDSCATGGAGSRLYRTGDLVCSDINGDLLYLGRTDFQLKVRGFRIEPGEIEGLLEQQPGVARAVVASVQQRLVAWITVLPEAQSEPAALLATLRAQLPDYMVPALISVVEQMPLNSNGKVDRKALPAPDFAQQQRVFEAPQTNAEQQLAQLWAQLLEVEQVGRYDSFFELGGTSLLLNRLKHQLSEQLGLSVTLAELFHNASLKAQAELIDQNQQHDEASLDFMESLLGELEAGEL